MRSSVRMYTIRAGFVAIPSSCAERYDTLATDGDTGSASSARAFAVIISAHKSQITSHSPHVPPARRLCVDAQSGVPASDSRSHFHGRHSLGSATEMVVMVVSGTVSSVVGMIGTEARLSV
jgi:hypothetical protein